jgi:catechol 2,3-dioxygenase-like lactoylglutathione lyase family enzyme
VDWKIEVVLLPVEDVDRAKAFYTGKMGFNLDVDHRAGESFRVVQMTPPGSACSVTVGVGITDAEPGSYRGTHLVVTDIKAAHAELVERGVECTEIQHFEDGQMRPGPDPDDSPFNSFVFLSDPDGNTWAVQQGPKPETKD